MSDDHGNDTPPGDDGRPSHPWGPALDAGLGALPCPPLPAAVAERVARLAHAHLAPPPELASPALGLRLREALVPALLMSAAMVRTADTVHVAREVFGDHDPGEGEPR